MLQFLHSHPCRPDVFVYVSAAPIFDEFTGDGVDTHRARWSLFRTSGESVEGLPSLSTGVSENYGSRCRRTSLPSLLIEGIGQLFGFRIGDGAGFRSGEFVIQLLALLVPWRNHCRGMVFFAADRIAEHHAV